MSELRRKPRTGSIGLIQRIQCSSDHRVMFWGDNKGSAGVLGWARGTVIQVTEISLSNRVVYGLGDVMTKLETTTSRLRRESLISYNVIQKYLRYMLYFTQLVSIQNLSALMQPSISPETSGRRIGRSRRCRPPEASCGLPSASPAAFAGARCRWHVASGARPCGTA